MNDSATLTVHAVALDGVAVDGALERLLSADEAERAARFRFPRDRRRFIAARATLRRTLGERLGRDPRALRFDYGPHGKPGLADDPIRFNLTHADGFALIALGAAGPVGIDLEALRPDMPDESLMRWVCADREAELLRALAPEARTERFFQLWTRKEAFCKVRGDGLALDVRRIDAARDDESADDWFFVRSQTLPTDTIRLRRLDIFPGYAATVAAAYPVNALEIRSSV